MCVSCKKKLIFACMSRALYFSTHTVSVSNGAASESSIQRQSRWTLLHDKEGCKTLLYTCTFDDLCVSPLPRCRHAGRC